MPAFDPEAFDAQVFETEQAASSIEPEIVYGTRGSGAPVAWTILRPSAA